VKYSIYILLAIMALVGYVGGYYDGKGAGWGEGFDEGAHFVLSHEVVENRSCYNVNKTKFYEYYGNLHPFFLKPESKKKPKTLL
jgi:hypothetical protein